MQNVFEKGEWWGVFLDENLIAISWLHSINESFFTINNSYWNIKDILNNDLNEVMVCGYIYSKEKNDEIYSLFLNLFNMQSLKKEKSVIVHFLRFEENWGINPLFKQNFKLRALRGVENITPTYIFLKKASLKNKIENKKIVKKIDIKNTKEISKLLENEYIGYQLIDGEIHFFINKDTK